jgi:hypothetical protein|tara:strand:- start:72 stop:455 length:384 start_codon:yes stop_codon:yes gene_type:complete
VFQTAPSLFRGIRFSSILYLALFLAHIVAAARDWDTVFKVIAALITVMTFAVGPSIIAFGRIKVHEEKIQANTVGFAVGLVLSSGLAWAYADQSFDIRLTLAFLLITTILHSSHRMLLIQKRPKKMG